MQKIVIIIGATASGKSDLAVNYALEKRLKGIECAIISADSRQVYKDLDIGSGKITQEEMQGVPHYGLDIAIPMERFTVYDWMLYTEKKIEELAGKNIVPIICGGSGLYIDALIYGLDNYTDIDQSLRLEFANSSLLEIQNKLSEIDNDFYQSLNNSEKHNRQRLIRKIEILTSLNKSKHSNGESNALLTNKLQSKNERYDIEMIITNFDKETLQTRIQNRLYKRLQKSYNGGLIAEVQNIIDYLLMSGHNRLEIDNWLISLGLEYKYVAMYLSKAIDKEQMCELILKSIIRYAKRQMTWNKKYKIGRSFLAI